MSKTKVMSSRIDIEIADHFINTCEKLKIRPATVMQELLKDFVVRNINKEAHESVEILSPKIKDDD